MRELSCGKVGDELLHTLWLQRLPQQLQTILSASNDVLSQLVILADKIFDTIINSSIQAFSSNTQNFDSDLRKASYKLEETIDYFKKGSHASLYIKETSFGTYYLIDTGADISAIPPSSKEVMLHITLICLLPMVLKLKLTV